MNWLDVKVVGSGNNQKLEIGVSPKAKNADAGSYKAQVTVQGSEVETKKVTLNLIVQKAISTVMFSKQRPLISGGKDVVTLLPGGEERDLQGRSGFAWLPTIRPANE